MNWITCLVVVDFNLKEGVQVALVEPPGSLTEFDCHQVSSCSFPDSNSTGRAGDINFTFRFVAEDGRALFGFTIFRQKPDLSLQRGFLQKSCVLISENPFIQIHMSAISHIGCLAHDLGNASDVFKEALRHISEWPEPSFDTLLLPLLGSAETFQIPIPNTQTTPSLHRSSRKSREQRRGSTHGIIPMGPIPGLPVPSFSYVIGSGERALRLMLMNRGVGQFQRSLAPLLSSFRKEIGGQPLIIMGDNISQVSSTVLNLTSLIDPCPFNCDFRPYFTIYDGDFAKLIEAKEAIPNVLLGVTNPFFSKILDHWPNILRLGSGLADESVPPSPAVLAQLKDPLVIESVPQKSAQPTRLLKTNALGLCQPKDSHRIADLKSGDEEKIRSVFASMMDEFLRPYDRYFRPPEINGFGPNAFLYEAELEYFNEGVFFDGLKRLPKPEVMSCDVKGYAKLHKMFQESPNFEGLMSMRNFSSSEISRLYRRVRLSLDMDQLCQGKTELQLIDIFLRIKKIISQTPSDDEMMHSKLQEHLSAVVNRLPEDLQESLRMTET